MEIRTFWTIFSRPKMITTTNAVSWGREFEQKVRKVMWAHCWFCLLPPIFNWSLVFRVCDAMGKTVLCVTQSPHHEEEEIQPLTVSLFNYSSKTSSPTGYNGIFTHSDRIYCILHGMISCCHFIDGEMQHILSRRVYVQSIKMTDMTDLDRIENYPEVHEGVQKAISAPKQVAGRKCKWMHM